MYDEVEGEGGLHAIGAQDRACLPLERPFERVGRISMWDG